MDGYPFESSGALDADHALPVETERQRVGHRDYLHDAAIDQPLHTLAHRGLGQAHDLAAPSARAAGILLQRLDDPLGQVIEDHAGRIAGAAPAAAPREAV